MKTLKKTIKIMFVLTIIIPILLGIVMFSIMSIKNSQSIELEVDEFVEIIKKSKSERIAIDNDKYEISDKSSGKKYYCIISADEEQERIHDELNSYGNYFIFERKRSFKDYGISLVLGILIAMIAISLLMVWFLVLFDLLKSEFLNSNDKWIWFLCLILLPFIGPAYYIFIAEKQKLVK